MMVPNNFQVSLDAAFPAPGNGGAGPVTGNSLAIAAAGGPATNPTVSIPGPRPTASLPAFDAMGRLVRTRPVADSGNATRSLQDRPAGIHSLHYGAFSQRLMAH